MKKVVFLLIFFFFLISCASTNPPPETNAVTYSGWGYAMGSIKSKPTAEVVGDAGFKLGLVSDTARIVYWIGSKFYKLYKKKFPHYDFIKKFTVEKYIQSCNFTGDEYYYGEEDDLNDNSLIYDTYSTTKYWEYIDREDGDIPAYDGKDKFKFFVAL